MKKVIIFLLMSIMLFYAVSAAVGPVNPPSKTDKSDETLEQMQEKTECKDLPTINDRTKCRISLPEDAYDNADVPEECRALGGGLNGENCVKRYQLLNKCFTSKNYGFQVVCAKNALNFKTGNVRDAIEACDAETNRLECYQNLKEDVYSLTKFRIYALEEHIEDLKDEGKISEDAAVTAIAKLEERKQDFNRVNEIDGKKQVISDVQKIWRDLKENENL